MRRHGLQTERAVAAPQVRQGGRGNGDDARSDCVDDPGSLPAERRGRTQVSPDALRSLTASRAGSRSETGGDGDQNMQGTKERFSVRILRFHLKTGSIDPLLSRQKYSDAVSPFTPIRRVIL